MHPARITTADQATQRRWQVQALAWRIMYGYWRDDLRYRIRREVGDTRADAWGEPDLGANLAKTASAAVATLYDDAPEVYHDDPTALETMRQVLTDTSWASVMQRLQRDTIGIRDYLMHVEVADGALVMCPVPPHEVEVLAVDPRRRDQPTAIKWWRLRDVRGSEVWTCDVWDSRPGRERYATENEAGKDISADVLDMDGIPAPAGGWKGAAYPYRDRSGRAYIPWVAYHAALTGQMWDYGTATEIVDATLAIGTLWTYWRHLVQTASWPQRYLIGGIVAGGEQVGEGSTARTVVITDPAVLLQIVPHESFDGQPSVTQDRTNADPQQLGDAIASYERRAIAMAGLNPADVTRIDGDPRSGYAMAVTRDGQREAQRRYRPAFEASDLLLLRLTARMAGLPDTGWRIAYRAIPPTVSELREMQQYVDGEIAAGRMTDLQAYMMLHPGVSEQDAQTILEAIQMTQAPPPAPTAEPVVPDDEEDPDE